MSDIFHSFVESAKSIAVENNVKWDTPTRTDGKILKPYIWDLSKMSGSPPTPRILLTNLRPDKRTKEDYLEQCLFEVIIRHLKIKLVGDFDRVAQPLNHHVSWEVLL